MKQITILLFSSIIFLASCVKDRLQPVQTGPTGPIYTAGDTVMFYWNFNNEDSANHTPDIALVNGAFFSYAASYIDYTTGSSMGLPDSTTAAGSCLRVRNPSTSLTFSMPTTGYKNIAFQFAEQRSNSGPSQNSIYYTVDGQNYISANKTYTVDTTFNTFSVDLSSDPAVNNNTKFGVRILFNNNNTGTSGNDRFDNVMLVGQKQ